MSAASIQRAEQIRLLHKQVPTSLAGGLILMLVLSVTFFGSVETSHLFGWAALIVVIAIARLFSYRRARRILDDDECVMRWSREMFWLLALAGVVWGAGGWLLYPPQPSMLTGLLVAFYVCLITGSLGALSALPAAFLVYVLPLATPLLLCLVLDHEVLGIAISLGYALFVIIGYGYCLNMNATTIESINFRFENRELVDRLTAKTDKLAEAQQQAEQASKAKSEFLAAASHDLAQPLHALDLFLGALEMEKDYQKWPGLAENAKQCSRLLNQQFTSILDFSRIESGAVSAKPSICNLKTVVSPLVTEFDELCREQTIELHVDLEDATLFTDPTILQRILRNLLSNAVKYTERGSIRLTARVTGSQCEFCVADTGCGIAESELQSITKEYYRVQNPSHTQNTGLGLGLTIVTRLGELLGGYLDINSVPEEGSEFKFVLPSVANSEPAFNDVMPNTRPNLEGLTVLVVEDDTMVGAGLKTVLTQCGAEVTLASNAEAVHELLGKGFDCEIIVSDYDLGAGLNGIETIKSVRSTLGRAIPALLISGDTTLSPGRGPDGVQIVSKSVGSDRILARISQLTA